MIATMRASCFAVVLALAALASPANGHGCPTPGTTFTYDSGVNVVARGQDGMDGRMEMVGGKPFKVRGLLIANPSPDGADTSALDRKSTRLNSSHTDIS